jgi:hypothetical protein
LKGNRASTGFPTAGFYRRAYALCFGATEGFWAICFVTAECEKLEYLSAAVKPGKVARRVSRTGTSRNESEVSGLTLDITPD